MEKLDAVYLEPDIGSLFGAVALAAGGLKVLILEGSRRTRKDKSGDDDSWSLIPDEPFLLRGLRTGGFLEPLLNRLGLLIKAREKVERIDPSFQVVTPDARIEMRTEKMDMVREMAREFGAAGKSGSALFARFEQIAAEVYKVAGGDTFPSVPKKGKFFKKSAHAEPEVQALRSPSLSSVLAESRMDVSFRNLTLAAVAAMCGPSSVDAPAAAAATVLDSARRGVYRANIPELSKMLVSTFKAKGGYTFPLYELESAEISGREISALRASKSNFIKSRFFVGSPLKWLDYLPPEFKSAYMPPGTPQLHKLDLMLGEEAVPVGMMERVVVLPRNTDSIYPETVLKILVSPAAEVEGERRRVITIESVRPAAEDARGELKDHLRTVIPFLDEFIRNERYSVEPVFVSLDSGHPFLDLPEAGPIENLIPCEGEILQGMGLGENVVSGRLLARVILKKMGLRAEI